MKKNQSIVILHGWGLSGGLYEPLAEIFRKRGFTVFCPDFPGFGKSEPPKRIWGLSDYTDFLHNFIKTYEIETPIFIGHSFGGRVALNYQLRYPKQTKALVLTGTPGFTPVPRRKLMLFIFLAKIGKFLVSLVPFSDFRTAVQRWYYYAVGARDFYKAQGVMREIFKTIVEENLEKSMEAVSCPALLVWGADDIIVPVSIAYRMQKVIKGAGLEIIPGSDHGVVYKMPQEFADPVIRFLSPL